MYIPLAYWNTQGDAYPTMTLSLFAGTGIKDLKYTYEGTATTSSFSGGLLIQNYCADIYNASDLQNDINPINALISGPLYFCSASPSASNLTSSQCCVSSPPNTGPEAWYFDVSYNGSDRGTYYYNYINETGRIVNDTISFGQTKRIIAQAAPLVSRQNSDFFGYYINWVAAERYPGDVITYPLKGVASLYTLQLKRDSARTPGTYQFPDILLSALDYNSNINAFTVSGKGQLLQELPGTLNSTASYTSADVPIDYNDLLNGLGNTVWIISASVLPGPAYRITSCTTSQSMWVTLSNNLTYNTGSILQSDTYRLALTGSCWQITNVTSSLATSSFVTNVNVTNVYNNCVDCPELPPPPPTPLPIYPAVSQSIKTYIDIAYTGSYAGQGNILTDLTRNEISGTLDNSSAWIYDTTTLSTPVLRLQTTGSVSRVRLPNITVSGSYALAISVYNKNVKSYNRPEVPLFQTNPDSFATDVDGLINFSGTSIYSSIELDANPNLFKIQDLITSSWNVYQISYDSVNNRINYAVNNITGSYTSSVSWSVNASEQFNVFGEGPGGGGLGGTYGTGSIIQYMAVYTGSLSTSQMLQNYNAISGRYI